MAVISPTITEAESGSFVATWASVTEADTCNPVAFGGAPDRSVQVSGTFGGTSVGLQGSNDGSNYAVLTDPQGNNLAITAAKIEAVSELTRYMKPVLTGGASVSVTVSLFMAGGRR